MQQASFMIFLHYLTTVFDNINDGLLLIGIEPQNVHRLLMANKVFFEISGFPEDSVGKKVSEIVGIDGYKILTSRYERAIKSKKPYEYMEWYDLPAGRLAFEVRMIPVLNAVGECVQIIAITRNVTEREKLRQEVKTLRAEVATKKSKA